MQLKRRRKKILKLLIKYTTLSTDVINLILGYSLHSKYNEKIYNKKMPLYIPLVVTQFDQKLFTKIIQYERGWWLYSTLTRKLVDIRLLRIDVSPLKWYYEIYITCPINFRAYQFVCGCDDIEYDGVVIFNLHTKKQSIIVENGIITQFKLIIV